MSPRLHHFQPILLLFGAFVITVPACHKQFGDPPSRYQTLVAQAQCFVDSLSSYSRLSNYRAAQPKTVRWDLAQVLPTASNHALTAPIIFDNDLLIQSSLAGNLRFHLNYLTQLLYTVDSTGAAHAFIITDFPDSSFFTHPDGRFTGLRFIEDWNGNPIEKLLYRLHGPIRRYTASNTRAADINVIQTCYAIDGYNYSPSTGETYTWSEPAGCSVQYIESGSSGGGIAGILPPGGGPASGGRVAGADLVSVLPGNSVIKSIKAYFQCFTNVGGSDHHYTVTVCVDEPVSGTRTPWTTSGSGSSGSSAGSNVIYTGHSFFVLTETYGNTVITRNVGFYPSGNVNPVSTISQGELNDDELHSYNISGTFTVTNAQFFNVLNFISQGSSTGYLYDLNTNNCTTFVINAAAQAGITLPRTIGTWLGGAGDDPGDLGEDLRKNNIPGMNLSLLPGTYYSHPNAGQCN